MNENEILARAMASVYEPDLHWDNPKEYDLLDRTELTSTAAKIIERLKWSGFAIARHDDLCLDEFDTEGVSA